MLSRRRFLVLTGACASLVLVGCSDQPDNHAVRSTDIAQDDSQNSNNAGASGRDPKTVDGISFTEGSVIDRGFVVDDMLETDGRTIHFSLHIPDAYDGSMPYALYIACPGWEGLYFQGVGANLQEDFPFVANDYISDMIVASPQLNDWGKASAEDVIALTEWLLAAFNIDSERVYLSGCSGGGETISFVLGMQPKLYRRALHTISRWDGDIAVLADARVPVYMAIGENDDYYGADPARSAYADIRDAYQVRGLSEEQVNDLIVLDVKSESYFTERGWQAGASQHAGGGMLFPHDDRIMGWLFKQFGFDE